MKKLLLAFMLMSVIVSCGGNSGKKSEKKTEYSLLDVCDFIYKYNSNPASLQIDNSNFTKDYGFVFQGWYTSEGVPIGVWVKDCAYDPSTGNLNVNKENGQAFIAACDPDNRNFCLGAFHYVCSQQEAEKVREIMSKENHFAKSTQEGNVVFYKNSYMGVYEEPVQFGNYSGVKFSTTPLLGTEDYPFKASLSISDVKSQIQNEFKFKRDYEQKRLKLRGKVIKISEVSGKVTYEFSDSDYGTDLFVKIASDKEAYTDFSLPANVTISGYVSDVWDIFITLKDVRIWDSGHQQYVGITPFDAQSLSIFQNNDDDEDEVFESLNYRLGGEYIDAENHEWEEE